MIRALRYFIVIGVLAGIAAWLADQPGSVSLEWAGYRIDTSFGVLAVALGVLVVLSGLLYRIWLFIRRAPGSARLSWRGHRRSRGYQALTKGMVAVAAGDAEEARRQARKADNLLSEPPLTMLLSAQAAQLGGDERAAERFFRAMTENRETEFLGLRGLLNQAMKRQDMDEAVALARRAHRLKPNSEWVSQSLFELQTRSGKWLDASVTVKEAAKNRHLTSPDGRHRQAVLAYQMSLAAEENGDPAEALKQAKSSLDLDGNFLPAALGLARHYMSTGKVRKAGALIERMWGREPHPAFANLYGDVRGANTPLERVKAAERLRGFNPGDPESDLAVARAALGADLWGQARKHLEIAGAEDPSARICRMMSDLEEAEHGDATKARQWLVRASLADPDPAWVCGSCGHTVEGWCAVCSSCNGFDTLAWRTPPHVMRIEVSGPEGADDNMTDGVPAIAADVALTTVVTVPDKKAVPQAYIDHDRADGEAGPDGGKPPLIKQPLPAEG